MNAARLPAVEASKEPSSHAAVSHAAVSHAVVSHAVVSRGVVATGERRHGVAPNDTARDNGVSERNSGAPADGTASHSAGSHSALSECVTRTIRRYLADIGDTVCDEGLHALVIREVEGPLLREVLAFHDGNQSRAASVLGINRATLRKKLAAHGLL